MQIEENICYKGKRNIFCLLNLSYDGVLKPPGFDGGGGVESTPPLFFCENNRKGKKSSVVILKIWTFFTYFIYLSVMGRYNPSSKLSEKCPKLPLKKKSIQCTILLVFLLFSKIKMGGGRFNPPPPLKLGVLNTLSKLR